MKRVTVSQLRNDLDGYLEKVRAGESVLILDRNRPVARLEGIEGQGPLDDRLARLESEGLVRRALRPIPRALLEAPLPEPRDSVLAALVEERRQGR